MASDLPFLPFSRPDIGPAEIAEVTATLGSGWITTGPRSARFEEMLREYLGAPHVLALSSATAGLHLALAALDLAPGDEVITTPLTFVATLNTIVAAGGRPVLVDIDADTLNLDVERLEGALTARTRAIVPVHFAGRPVDLEPLYALAARHGLRVIEDAAQAIGASYRGQRLGSFGDVQVFSFHPNKNMTTGEGGCVVTRDAALARRVAVLRFHGIDRDAWNRHAKGGSPHYDIIAPGFKYNFMDIQAALGIHQLPRLDGFNVRRAAIVARYQAGLSDLAALRLPAAADPRDGHVWNLYTPRVTGHDRDGLMEQLKERGIGTGLHYQATHLHRYYREQFGFQAGDFPVAEAACEGIFSLPLFSSMTDDEADRVIEALHEVLS